MNGEIVYEKLRACHLPYFYEIRFSVEENLLHPHQIQYLLRKQALDDINQDGGWICKVDNEYAGFCFAVFIPEAIVGGLFVKPEYQSIGIGSALISRVTEWCFSNGAEEIRLTTDPGSKAEGFYRNHGWLSVGRDEFGQIEFLKRKG